MAASGGGPLALFLDEIDRTSDSNFLRAVKYSDLVELATARVAAAAESGAPPKPPPSSSSSSSSSSLTGRSDPLSRFRAEVLTSSDMNFLRAAKYTDFHELAAQRLARLLPAAATTAATTTATAAAATTTTATDSATQPLPAASVDTGRSSPLLSRAERVLAAVVGGFVADAAAQTSHWVYSDDLIRTKLARPDPEFSTEQLNPFYRMPTGELTCYGDQALAALRAVHKALVLSDGADLAAPDSSSSGVSEDALADVTAEYKLQLKALCGDGSAYGAFPEPPGSRDRDVLPIPRKVRDFYIHLTGPCCDLRDWCTDSCCAYHPR